MKWHHRKRLRLKDYDYSTPGPYFVTVCVNDQFKKTNVFGKISSSKVFLSNIGEIILHCWLDLPNHYNIQLDHFIIMPDHVHGIIIINKNDSKKIAIDSNHDGMVVNGICSERSQTVHYTYYNKKSMCKFKTHGLSEIVRGFKSFSSHRINKSNYKQHFRWQKSFYDHIIRTKQDLFAIRNYIKNNPVNA